MKTLDLMVGKWLFGEKRKNALEAVMGSIEDNSSLNSLATEKWGNKTKQTPLEKPARKAVFSRESWF